MKEVVSALPKSAPAEPEAEVGPVFVIPAPARTTKELVVPSRTRDSEAELPVERLVEIATKNSTAATEKATKCLVILNGVFAVFGVLKVFPRVFGAHPNLNRHLPDYTQEIFGGPEELEGGENEGNNRSDD